MALKCRPPMLACADRSAARVPPKVRDNFYITPEFKAWREIVIGRAGRRCEKCGRVERRMFADHIVEVKDGGAKLDPANGQCLCGSCHTLKTNPAKASTRPQSIPAGDFSPSGFAFDKQSNINQSERYQWREAANVLARGVNRDR
jgi:5-methylcytosine-specific restriction endonuclease McrA